VIVTALLHVMVQMQLHESNPKCSCAFMRMSPGRVSMTLGHVHAGVPLVSLTHQ
jgi:hypothetical protein